MKRVSIGIKAPTLGVVPKKSKVGNSKDILNSSYSSFNVQQNSRNNLRNKNRAVSKSGNYDYGSIHTDESDKCISQYSGIPRKAS